MESDNKHQPFCQFIRENLPEWESLSDSDIKFEPLQSLTNQVFKVTSLKPNTTPNPIIFRKFNENPHVVDRPTERKLFKAMAESGNGPKCYVDSEKYRIEEYIHSKGLIGSDYNKANIRREISRALAKFHKVDIPWLKKARFLPDDLANEAVCRAFEEKCDSDIYDESQKEIVKQIRKIMGKEEKEFLDKIIPGDDIVLSHNDLSHENQLLREDTGEMMFIDLEYCGKNFRGFDIGYMYQESIFTPSDEPPYYGVQEENFPTDDQLKDFIRYYIVFTDMDHEEEFARGKKLISDEGEFERYIKEKYNEEDFGQRIEKLLREVKIGALVCCHYIVTWAMKMYKTASNEFGYFEYACGGYKRYMKYKEELAKGL